MKVSSPPKYYHPVGRCIYCGSKGDDLRREHIIPYALGGNLVLPKSSCRKCEKITGRFELHCLREALGSFRTKFNYPTRRPKERKKTLRLILNTSDEKTEIREVSVSHYPHRLFLPRFTDAGILTGKEPSTGITLQAWAGKMGQDPPHTAGKKIVSGPLHLGRFCQMLAKISHSFIIAERGYEEASKYTMLLPDLILSRHNNIGYLIGGQIAENQPPDQNVHHVMSVIHMRRGNQEFLIAEIRLFANWGAPHYHAVFGVRDITT